MSSKQASASAMTLFRVAAMLGVLLILLKEVFWVTWLPVAGGHGAQLGVFLGIAFVVAELVHMANEGKLNFIPRAGIALLNGIERMRTPRSLRSSPERLAVPVIFDGEDG